MSVNQQQQQQQQPASPSILSTTDSNTTTSSSSSSSNRQQQQQQQQQSFPNPPHLLRQQPNSSSTLFNPSVGAPPPIYQHTLDASISKHSFAPSYNSTAAPAAAAGPSSTRDQPTMPDSPQDDAPHQSRLPQQQQQPDVIHYQPHTTAPRIALTDPLADMRARNLSRPHGLGKNSDWPESHSQPRPHHPLAQTPIASRADSFPNEKDATPLAAEDSPRDANAPYGTMSSGHPSRPGFSRQASEMSLSQSELEHTYGGDDDGMDPDDYAWSDEEDVEESAKFEEEAAKDLRVGGRGRLSLWKIIRFLATTFLGNLIISSILIAPVLVLQFYYRKHLPPYVDSESPEANALRNRQDFIADNVQAAFIWASLNLHMMWWLHIAVELFPRCVLGVVRAVWGSVSQRLLNLAEFYASCKQFIKPVFYAAFSWASWAIIYGLYDLYNHSDTALSRATYAPRLYQVVEFFFFLVLTICAEKILIKFIAMKFHTSAYAERLAKVTQALQVLDILRDYRPQPSVGPSGGAAGSRPSTPAMFASAFGLPKGFGGPPQAAGKSGSGRSTPMRMDPVAYNNGKGGTAIGDTSTSSADNSLSKKRHADRRPPYFAVEDGDSGAEGMADDEGGAPHASAYDRVKFGTSGSKTLVEQRKTSGSSSSSAGGGTASPSTTQQRPRAASTMVLRDPQPKYAQKKGAGLSLQNLFHPASRRNTVEDPNTGIELDAQTGMPLRNRSNFEGTEGDTPAGSGYHPGRSYYRPHAPSSDDHAAGGGGGADKSISAASTSRRKRVRQRALATASQARAIARVVMQDPFNLLSNSQLLGGVGVDVTGPAEAKRLARSIFKRFRGTHRRRYLVEADFEPAFEGNKEEAKKAFAVFDRDGNGDISQAEIKNTVLAVYKERRFLSRSVQDVHHAVKTLDLVILCFAMVIVLFEGLAIFNVNISKMVTTVYTLGLAFAFIFKQTASNVFDSIVFLFVTHAFDTGDRIMLGEQIMVVKRMSLLSTQFTLADGTDMYVSNALLGTLMITNFRRSGYQWESVALQFPFDTPLAKLDAVEEDMKHWLATEPGRMFEPSTSIVPQHMDNMRSLSCTVGMTHRANWQDWGARFARRNAFYAALTYYCKKHGVRYATSLQPVVYWEEDDTGFPPSYTDDSGLDPQNKRVWVPDEANDDFAPSPPPTPAPGTTATAAAAAPTKPRNYMGFTPPPDEIEGSGLRRRRAKRSEKALAGQGGE